MSLIIAADNGITGCWCVMLDGTVVDFFPVPTFSFADQKKTKVSHTTRIDVDKLTQRLMRHCDDRKSARVFIERPKIDPTKFKATLSSARAYEATLIALEDLGVGYRRIDSKDWQREFWPAPKKGQKIDTKKLSKEIALQIFPQCAELIEKRDGDALLMAEWARRHS